jgi:leucyl-tRNA synthetase
VEIAVKVNGKTRGRIQVTRDIAEPDAVAAALAVPAIAKFVPGPPRKVVFVRGRLLNVVT